MRDENALLGERLRRARERAGMSQEQVAIAMQLARTTVSGIESGTRKVTAVELRKLARLYCRDIEVLLGADPGSADSEALARLTARFNGLSDYDQRAVLSFAEFLASLRRRQLG